MDTRTDTFIARLASDLHQRIKGAEVAECFSQNKDELVFGFALPHVDFWIQADLTPEAGMLYFPDTYHRAKKNSVNILPDILGKCVIQVCAHKDERSFQIDLTDGLQLMFKMHGRNANVILFSHGSVSDIFRHNLESDQNILLSSYEIAAPLAITSAVEEANQAYEDFRRTFYIKKEKEEIIRSLRAKIAKSENYIAKTNQKQEEVLQKADYEKLGHILMANVHLKIANQPATQLFDFYENNDIVIKLKPELSLQKNAEIYYRKAKNQKIELDNISKNILAKQELIALLYLHLQKIEQIGDLKELRQYIKQHKLVVETAPQVQVFPFYTFEQDGFQIWVGKNAQNNDLLTLKYTHKDDLWLHAKDVPGSHVVIKYQAGKTFPKPVIEKAAQLAAYYSKRKSDTLVPVTVTPRKFVRKPKGVAPGMVVVEREDVILVSPARQV